MADIEITFIFDPVCPWCYIGKRRLEAAMAERSQYNFQVRYLPYQLNPDMPEEGADRQNYLAAKFKGDEGASQAYAPIKKAQATLGLDMRLDDIKTTPNSVKAHILVQFLQQEKADSAVCDDFVESLFRAYFCDGKDIGDAATLQELWEAVAVADLPQVKSLVSEAGYLEFVTESQTAAEDARIGGVPFYIINGEYSLSGAQEPQAFLPIFDVAAQNKS